MKSCCCTPCQTSLGSREFGEVCCKCVPKRICVTIWPPTSSGTACPCGAWDLDDPDSSLKKTTVYLECDNDSNSYSGVFLCGTEEIDIKFSYERYPDSVGGLCYFVFESIALGYYSQQEDFDINDTRIKKLMGDSASATGTGTSSEAGTGTVVDLSLRRDQCLDPVFDFEVDFSSLIPACGEALIQTQAADYIYTVIDRNWEYSPNCWCQCVKIGLIQNGETRLVSTCWDEDTSSWTAIFTGPTGTGSESTDVTVTISLDAGTGATSLSLTSSLGDGDSTFADCDNCRGMSASWEIDSETTIYIVCDPHLGCVDCKCWCNCVCIIYSDSRNAAVVRDCYQHINTTGTGTDTIIDGWAATFSFDAGYEEISVEIQKICDASTGITQLHLITDLALGTASEVVTQDDPYPLTDCPEISAAWTLQKANGDRATISIQCDNCGDCSGLIQEPCCPVPIPLILYATVTGFQSCLGNVLDPPIVDDCDEFTFPVVFTSNPPAGPALWRGMGEITCPHADHIFLAGVDCRDLPKFLQVELGCAGVGVSGVAGLTILKIRLCCVDMDGNLQCEELTGWTADEMNSTCNPAYITVSGIEITQTTATDPPCSSATTMSLSLVITE